MAYWEALKVDIFTSKYFKLASELMQHLKIKRFSSIVKKNSFYNFVFHGSLDTICSSFSVLIRLVILFSFVSIFLLATSL